MSYSSDSESSIQYDESDSESEFMDPDPELDRYIRKKDVATFVGEKLVQSAVQMDEWIYENVEFLIPKSIVANPSFIKTLKTRLVHYNEKKHFVVWKEMYKFAIDILTKKFFDYDHETFYYADTFVKNSTNLINLVDNWTNFAIWIFKNAYKIFGKLVIKKPYTDNDNLVAWKPKFKYQNRRDTFIKMFEYEDKLKMVINNFISTHQ